MIKSILHRTIVISGVSLCVCLFVCACSSTAKDKDKDENVIRKPGLPPLAVEKLELDNEYRRVQDSTKYGQGETKSWNERYRGEDSSYPYQGPVK